MLANFIIISVIPVSILLILSVILYGRLQRLKKSTLSNPIDKGKKFFQGQFGNEEDMSALQEKYSRFNRLYFFISQMNQMLIKAGNEETLFKQACRIAVEAGKFKMAWIGLYDDETKRLVPVNHAGEESSYLSIINIIPIDGSPQGVGPAGSALLEGKYIVCNDIADSPEMVPWREKALSRNYHSSIGLPIKKYGNTVGVFSLYADTKNFFDKEEISLLNEIAGDISYALEVFDQEKLRKKAEEELLKSKRSYQILTETSPVGIFHTDASGLTTYVNPRWCKFSGIPPEEALGNGWLNALHPEDRKKVSTGWEQATLAHDSSVSEYRFVKPDGSITWILGQAIPECNEENEIIGYVGTATDITERKIAQEKIEKVLKEKETVLNRINDSMVSVDNEWRYTFLNDAALATHPLSKEETLGKNMWDVHPEMKGTIFWDKYHEAMQTRKVVEIENYFSPMKIWFSAKIYPSDDGLTIFYRDITDQKKAEEEIINKEKRFRALIENSTDGLSVLTTDGSVLDISLSGKKILGYNEEDVIGKIRSDLIHPDDLGMVSAIFDEVIHDAHFAKTIEYRHKMPDGSYRWLESSFKNLLHEPYLNGIVLNYRDITENKNAALQLKRSEEKYRKAQTIGRMGHWQLDLKTYMLTWSDEIYRIFDVGKNEYENLHDAFLNLMHPDDMEAFKKVEKEVLLGKSKLDFVHRIINKKGNIKYVHEVGEITCNDSGEEVLFTGTVQDISEQVIAQNEIIKERNLSDSIINTMPGVFYLYNQQGKLLRWNTNLEKVTLYSRLEIAQMHPLDFFDTDEKEIVGKKILNVFDVGEDTLQANFFLKTKKKVPYYFTGKSIIYEGNPCLVGVGIDFSDRVKAQEKIKETTEQLRELAAHLQNIREEERIDIARDIHDDLGQQLTAVKIGMFRLLKEVSGDIEKEKNVNVLIDMTGTCIESIRRISTQLRPGILDDLGLMEAMKWQIEEFEKRFAIPVQAHLPDNCPVLKPKITIGLFRMFQETLTNITRHANASVVKITFEVRETEIILTINDNGKGFDMEQIKTKRSFGLLGMQERAYMIGGNFQINSKLGQGTEIKIVVPVNY